MDYIFVKPREFWTADELKLSSLMSDISEEIYDAGWHLGLEDQLWSALIDNDNEMAKRIYHIDPDWLSELRRLVIVTSAWIVWDHQSDDAVAMSITAYRQIK